MHRDKIEPDTNGLFWGKPYKIYFKKNLTETPDCNDIPYRAPCIESPVDKRNHAHHQYHTMVIVTFQVADGRRTTTRGKRAKPVNLYGIDSSPIVKDDCPPRHGRNNNWGGSARRPRRRARTSTTSGGFIVIHFLFTYNRISSLH
jgi:hypothetical protein